MLSQFKPFEQLMAVFPAASRKHVPGPWQILMTDKVSEFSLTNSLTVA